MTSTIEVAPVDDRPFMMFRTTVSRVQVLSTNFRRFTLAGVDLAYFADNGRDQRIKLIFPVPGLGFSTMPDGPDWYRRWRELEETHRNPIRTYTVRAVRAEQNEIDVDIALHGRIGVASAWAMDATAGDELVVLGPNGLFPGYHGGVDFLPPVNTGRLLLVGDETAVPAIASILENLPSDAVGEVLIEVPHPSDSCALGACPTGVRVQVLSRDGGVPGCRLINAVEVTVAGLLADPVTPIEVEDVDVDTDMLWEVPADDAGGPALPGTDLYAWIAGEAGVVKVLRRHLVADHGIDRRSVAFMGYWRLGREENNG